MVLVTELARVHPSRHGQRRWFWFASDSKEKSAALEAAFPRYNQEPDPLSTVLRKSNYLAGLLAVAACVQKRFYSLTKRRAGAVGANVG
jgi:hypothetical protein